MKRLIVLFGLLLSCSIVTGQVKQRVTKKPKKYKPKEQPKVDVEELNAFVLSGYKMVTFTYGDFNDDKKQDAVLLLKKVGEEDLSDKSDKPVERPLLILMRGTDGKLKEVARNDRAVYCFKCGSEFGSPLTDIVIEGNTFSIQHESGKSERWTRLLSFEYSATTNVFNLTKDATSFYSISNTKPIKSSIKTNKDFGVISFEDFDVYSEDLKQKKA